jgi:hypothetical protein
MRRSSQSIPFIISQAQFASSLGLVWFGLVLVGGRPGFEPGRVSQQRRRSREALPFE